MKKFPPFSISPFFGRSRSTEARAGRSGLLKVWTVSFAIWTLLALFSAAGSCVYLTVASGHIPAWKSPLLWSLSDAYTWALITPLLYALSKRYSVGVRSWKSVVLFHLPVGIVCAYAAALLTITVNLAIPGTCPAIG